MPPKKGKKGAAVVDGVNTTEMTRKKLENLCLGIKQELDRTREERGLFQLERDKIRTFWELSRNELEETRAKLRNKDSQYEERLNKNDEELKLGQRRVKHIQYECLNALTETKVDYLVQTKSARDDCAAQEAELLHDKKELEQKFREQEFMHQEQIKELKLEASKQISDILKEFEKAAKELEKKYEKRFENLKQDANKKFADEISELEDRKSNQINELTANHQREFDEMKTYYNDLTFNNLALITKLEGQMEELRIQNVKIAKQLADVREKNRELTEELNQANNEVAECKKQLEHQEQDRRRLKDTKHEESAIKAEINALLFVHTALELRYEKLNAEKDVLDKRFKDAVLEVHQKTGMKNVLLQKKLECLAQQNQMKALLQNINEDEILEIFFEENSKIDELQSKLAYATKAYKDLLNIFLEKMRSLGVATEDLLPSLTRNVVLSK